MRIRPVETSGLPMPFQRRGQGPVIVGSPDPLAWANKADGAKHAWDFIANAARWNGQYIGALANTPNWTFTRASTAYYTNSAGVLTSVASGVLRTGDRGALIEGARTNLCLQSQTFDNASWTKTNCTISADATVAPDGTTTADEITDNATAGQHSAYSTSFSATNGTVYCGSVFAKQGTDTRIQIRFGSGVFGGVGYANFDLSVGTVSATGGTVVASGITALANGWYRCWLALTATSTSSELMYIQRISSGSAARAESYSGSSTNVYLWGAQVEAAAFSSSYIPTTTASATRAADSLSITGVTGLAYPLSLFAQFSRAVDTGGSDGVFNVNTGSSINNEIWLYVDSSDRAAGLMRSASTTVAAGVVTGALALNTMYKSAARFAENDWNLARGGVLSTLDTSCAVPSAPTVITFGARADASSPLFGYLERAAIFVGGKADAELQAVTV